MKRTSQLDASRRPPKHNPDLKYAHVQKTLRLLDKSIAQSIKSVNDIKASSDRETLALLYQSNVFANDMQRTVYDLQKIVIRTFKDGAFDPELESAAKQFGQFAYSVQQCFNDDPEILKNQIKENLSNIMPEARRLVESVRGDRNLEYIHEIVGVVDNILFAVQKIEYRNKLEDFTPDDLITEIIKLRDILFDKQDNLKHINHSALRDIKHSVRDSLEKILRIVKILDETADNYSDDIKSVLLEVSFNIMRDAATGDASLRSKSDVTTIKCINTIGISSLCLELENLVELLKVKIEDEQVASNLHNLVILVCIHWIAVAEQQIRHIEFATMQTNDD